MSESAAYRVSCGYDGPELVEVRIEACGSGKPEFEVVYDCAVVSGVVPFSAFQKLLHFADAGCKVICGSNYEVHEENCLE